MIPWVVAVVVVIVAIFNVMALIVPAFKLPPLIIASRMAGVQHSAKPRTYGAWDLIDVDGLYHGGIGAPLLTMYRALCFAVFCFVVIYKNVAEEVLLGRWFEYFTLWTFTGFGVYSVMGMILTAQAWRRGRQLPTTTNCSHSWRLVDKAFLIVFVTVCNASMLLTIFYWGALYSGSKSMLTNPFIHGVSAGMLLLDVMLSRVPIVSYHVQASIVYGTAYLAALWGIWGEQGRFVYGPLDWAKQSAVAYYIVLFVLLVICYGVMLAVAGLRDLLYTGICCVQWRWCGCRCCRRQDSEQHAVTVRAPGASSKQQADGYAPSRAPPIVSMG